jgi:hypothetical protein
VNECFNGICRFDEYSHLAVFGLIYGSVHRQYIDLYELIFGAWTTFDMCVTCAKRPLVAC